MPTAEAMTFCTSYSTHCSFTGAMRYMSMADCLTKFAGFAMNLKTCVKEHLENVVDAMGTADYEPYKTIHCPHATAINCPGT